MRMKPPFDVNSVFKLFLCLSKTNFVLLGHIVRRIFFIVLVLAKPEEFENTPSLEFKTEHLIFTPLWRATNDHLFFALHYRGWQHALSRISHTLPKV